MTQEEQANLNFAINLPTTLTDKQIWGFFLKGLWTNISDECLAGKASPKKSFFNDLHDLWCVIIQDLGV